MGKANGKQYVKEGFKMHSYLVRPVTFRDFGVYKVENNRAEVIFEGTQSECYEEKAKLEKEEQDGI